MINIVLIKARATEVVNGFSTVKYSDCMHLLNVIEELERERAATRRLKHALALALAQEDLNKQQNNKSNYDFADALKAAMKTKF